MNPNRKPRRIGAGPRHMVNGRLEYPWKRSVLSKIVAIQSAQACAFLLIGPARDRNRRFRLVSRAIHVEAAIAHLDVIAAEKAHPFDAARGAVAHVVFRQGVDNGGGPVSENEESRPL